jgi:hypothetical protein
MEPGSRCLICGEGLKAELVWCTSCSTPSHKDCFSYNGRCPIFGCQGMRFRTSESPRDRGVTWIEVKDDTGRAVPQSYIVDFTSTREGTAGVMILLGLFGMLMFGSPPKGFRGHWNFPYYEFPFYVSLAVGLIAGVLRLGFNDYRIVDAKSKTIWLHSHFFGVRTTTVETTFAQVREVVLAHRESCYKGNWSRKWHVWLRLKDGSAFQMTDEESQSIPHETSPVNTADVAAEKTADKIAAMVGVKREMLSNYAPTVTR